MIASLFVFNALDAIILIPGTHTVIAAYQWLVAPLLLTLLPAFYIMSGYLSSGLLMRAKYKGFFASRLKRISVLFWPAVAAAAALHFFAIHLLPIWYLMLASLVAVTISWISRRVSFSLRSRMSIFTSVFGFAPAWIGAYGVIIAVATGLFFGQKLPNQYTQWLALDWRLFVYSYLAFSLGWVLHRSGSTSLKKLANCALINLCLGGVLMSAASSLPGYLTLGAALTGGLFFAFALIGGFLALVHRQVRLLSYLADAGFWVFVWQPILAAAGLQILAPTPAFLGSVLVAFASYQFVIRKTPFGSFLSGRRRIKAAKSKT